MNRAVQPIVTATDLPVTYMPFSGNPYNLPLCVARILRRVSRTAPRWMDRPTANRANRCPNHRCDPSQLRAITENCIAEVAGTKVRATTEDLQSFAPSRPTPTHRFQCVV